MDVPMIIKFDQHRECRSCTNVDNADSDSDGPPDLDWTPNNSEDEGHPGLHTSSESETNYESDIDSQSHTERDTSVPLGRDSMSIAIAQGSGRETLLPTSLEIIPL